MRVPVNPQTRVPQGQLGYERPVDVSSGTRMLGQVVSQYAEELQRDNKRKEIFDVQRLVVDETNALQTDFEDRSQHAPLGAEGFTQQINTDYQARHEQMASDLKSRGYSDEAIQEFGTRLGTIRSQYVARAIDFQDKSGYAKTLGDAGDLATSLSQTTNSNPGSLPSAIEELRVALDHTPLDAVEKAAVFEKGKATILRGAQEGFATQHPEAVLGMYGMPSELTTTSPTNLPNGQQFDLPTYIKKLNPAEGTARNPKSSAVGHFQFLDSTMVEYYKKVYGNTGENTAQILAKRSDKGVMTKVVEKFTNDNVQKLIAANLPVNDATVYLAHFLGVNDAIKVIGAHADATIAGLVRGASRDANKAVFKKVHTAGDLIAWAHGKMGDAGDLQPAPPPTNVLAPPEQPAVDAQGKTGIPVLDMSTGSERQQMLTIARTIMNGREADAKASQREAHTAWINGFYNQLEDGKLGQSDLDTAYRNGLFNDFSERERAQNIIDSKIKKHTDLDNFETLIASGSKGNPFDNDTQKAVDAGFERGITWLTKTNPGKVDGLTYALHLWQKTGVLPTQGATMIRGALVSTNAMAVAGAASVASNMLTQNPNAFASIEGGEEIGRAAANYAHYVDDLGMTAQEAAQKIALQNSPEFQAKNKADQPARETFITSIVGDKNHQPVDVQKVINNSVFGERGWGIQDRLAGTVRGTFTAPQKAEAAQTYLELALDNFDKTHDPAAAHAFAARQMGRFYGVESGRMLKYPATKAYPPIMGSQEYIFDQAKGFVDKVAGFSVKKEDIWLQPTSSGSTAAAFRAGKAPPYEVHYKTQIDGQDVYHIIPGQVFVADLTEAKRAAAIKARKFEMGIRQKGRPSNSEVRRYGGPGN